MSSGQGILGVVLDLDVDPTLDFDGDMTPPSTQTLTVEPVKTRQGLHGGVKVYVAFMDKGGVKLNVYVNGSKSTTYAGEASGR